MMRFLILISFISAIFIESIWAIPSDFQAIYDANIKQAQGQLRSELISNNDDTYSFEMVTNATGIWKMLANGSVSEKSLFKIDKGALKSIQYNLDNSIRNIKSEVLFDWKNNKIQGLYKERIINLSLEEQVIDRVLLQLQIINAIREDDDLKLITILDKDVLKNIVIKRGNETEVIGVPFGKFDSIKIEHSKTDSEKINTLWLAKELDYIPVKLTQTENGRTTFTAELRDLIK